MDRAQFIFQSGSGANQHEFLSNAEAYFHTKQFAAATNASDRPTQAGRLRLPSSFTHEAQTLDTKGFLDQTQTHSMWFSQEGANGDQWHNMALGDHHNRYLWLSISKTITATILGKLLALHPEVSLTDRADRYLPALKGKAYGEAEIRHLLTLSSGVLWESNPIMLRSSVMRLARAFAFGGDLWPIIVDARRVDAPGSNHNYNSLDTQVLSHICEQIAGTDFGTLYNELIVKDLGFAHATKWICDDSGQPMAFGGWIAHPEDVLKLGQAYLKPTNLLGPDWIKQSTRINVRQKRTSDWDSGSWRGGFGYNWWVPASQRRDFIGIGVYNQFLYVCPTTKTVGVKHSGFDQYGMGADERTTLENTSISFFRQMTDHLAINRASFVM